MNLDAVGEERIEALPDRPSAGRAPSGVTEPLFLLAPPRSFTSVICAMLGQHPQLYGLLETSLFCAETMTEWWQSCESAKFPMAHGLLRTVAQLMFGGQTENDVREARGWLRRRNHCTTGYIFELLASQVSPRILVEKSPSMVYRLESLRRTHEMFPNARYVHLLRHPRGYVESVFKHLRIEQERGAAPAWLTTLATWPANEEPTVSATPDPQRSWLHLHGKIVEFLSTIPADRQLRIRSEDFLAAPDRTLVEILAWIGLDTSDAAVEEMKHPERWPYAMLGPQNARFGTDRFFLERPRLRADRVEPLRLEGPLSWRADGAGFSPEVTQMAMEFGYR